MANPIALEREWDPALTLFFPATLQLPHGSGTGLTRREEGASSRPRHRGGRVARGPAMLPELWQRFSPPGPCWQYCVIAVWWYGIQSYHPMGLSRRESSGGEMVLAQGRRQASSEQALLCKFAFSCVQTAKVIKYKMNKTKSVIYCPEHDRSPCWVFKCLLLQVCF